MVIFNDRKDDNVRDEYQKAATVVDGNLVVLAGAGAGKTASLIDRAHRLYKEHGRQLLLVTFSKAATNEMKERLFYPIRTQTIHGFCYHVMRRYLDEYRPELMPLQVADDGIRKSIAQRLLGDETHLDVAEFLSEVLLVKNGGMERPPRGSDRHKRLISYDRVLRSKGLIEFADFAPLTIELIKILDLEYNYYVLVDEAQDLTPVQYKLLREISQLGISYFGSPDQGIYGFRGANPEQLVRKSRENHCITYGINYRSTNEIVDLANTIGAVQMTSHGGNGGLVTSLGSFTDEFEEAKAVIAEAQLLEPSETMVLYRVNALSITLELEVLKRGVRYKVQGGRFVDNSDVKDILSYFRFAKGIQQPEDMERLKQVHKDRSMKITLSSMVMQIKKISSDTERFEYIKGKYEKYLRRNNIKTSLNPMAMVETTGIIIDKYGVDTLLLMASMDMETVEDAITFSTVHRAKGKESDNVFIFGVNNGLWPHSKGIESEERRVLYVAVTRARKRLYYSWSSENKSPYIELLSYNNNNNNNNEERQLEGIHYE